MEKLTDVILQNASKIRFHTPSHAGQLGFDMIKTDVTELPYTDNLLQPGEKITKLEENIASAYGAEACFISTQGATHNIFQAVYATAKDGAFLIVGKAHTSVYNALRFFDVKAYHVDGLKKGDETPGDVKTVFFTSPDYFGNVFPHIEEISEKLKERGITVIVDSAHGGHFMFSGELPPSASLFADMAIMSLHKTLPVSTGGSVLLTKRKYCEKCLLLRKMLHTTSPSFTTVCSMERAVENYVCNGETLYRKVIGEIEKFKDNLKKPFTVEKTDDITRLVVVSPYSGETVCEELFKKGFVAEMFYENKAVFIVNPYNGSELSKLCEAVNSVGVFPVYEKVEFPTKAHPEPTLIPFGGEPEKVSFNGALGRKIYLEAGFYPPGVPLLYSHDKITEEHMRFLSDKKMREKMFGLEKDGLFVIK